MAGGISERMVSTGEREGLEGQEPGGLSSGCEPHFLVQKQTSPHPLFQIRSVGSLTQSSEVQLTSDPCKALPLARKDTGCS